MDPHEQEVGEEQPRRSRRRRRRRRSEEAAVEAVPFNLRSTARQFAGLAVFGLFFLLVIAAPIPMGGNRDWAWAPMVVVVGLLGLLCATGLGGREGLRVSVEESTWLLLVGAAFLFFVAVVLLQMSSFGPLSESAPLYAKAGELLHQVLTPIPSLSVDASRDALLRCLACGLLFLIGRVLFQDRQWAKLLLLVFVASAVIVVTYAVFMHVTTGSCYVGSYLKKEGQYAPGERCLMSGTFVGSNNFGCFAGMALVASLALFFDGRRSHRQDQEPEFGEVANPIAKWLTGWRITMAGASVYFAGALLLSASRAGVAATAAAIMAMLYLLRRGQPRISLTKLAIIIGVISVAVLFLAGATFLHKTAGLGNIANLNRVVIWRASLEAFFAAPWLGWGLGTYNDIYAIHQPISIPLPNDKAHSTPLEFLVEVGIVGALPAFVACALPWAICLLGGLRRHGERELPVAAFAIATVAILHSMIDFSLQMPAIAFVVSAILGLGWAQSFRPAESARRSFAKGV
jgi:O-antigen ligase